MLRSLLCGSVMLAMALGFASESFGQNKKKGKRDDVAQATQEDYDKLKSMKELTVKLVFADVGTQGVSFRLEIPRWEANPKYKPPKVANPKNNNTNLYQQMQRLMQEQQQIARIKDPFQRQQRLQKLYQDMQRLQIQMAGMNNPKGQPQPKADPNNMPFIQVVDSKDFSLEVVDNVAVRRKDPPFAYDDKGNVVEYTKDDLEKLKGPDKTKPGFEAKYEDLMPGQTLKLFLLPPAAKKGAKDPAKDVKKDNEPAIPKAKLVKGNEDDNLFGPAPPPRARIGMILIMQDGPPLQLPDLKKKKKK